MSGEKTEMKNFYAVPEAAANRIERHIVSKDLAEIQVTECAQTTMEIMGIPRPPSGMRYEYDRKRRGFVLLPVK